MTRPKHDNPLVRAGTCQYSEWNVPFSFQQSLFVFQINPASLSSLQQGIQTSSLFRDTVTNIQSTSSASFKLCVKTTDSVGKGGTGGPRRRFERFCKIVRRSPPPLPPPTRTEFSLIRHLHEERDWNVGRHRKFNGLQIPFFSFTFT